MRDGPRRREGRAESRIYCCKLSTGPFIAKPGPAARISDHSLAAFLKPLLRHFWRHLRHFGADSYAVGVRGDKMEYAKLPDWRLVLGWLTLTFLAAVAYFVPIARLVDALVE
jgi:hypothetical protein